MKSLQKIKNIFRRPEEIARDRLDATKQTATTADKALDAFAENAEEIDGLIMTFIAQQNSLIDLLESLATSQVNSSRLYLLKQYGAAEAEIITQGEQMKRIKTALPTASKKEHKDIYALHFLNQTLAHYKPVIIPHNHLTHTTITTISFLHTAKSAEFEALSRYKPPSAFSLFQESAHVSPEISKILLRLCGCTSWINHGFPQPNRDASAIPERPEKQIKALAYAEGAAEKEKSNAKTLELTRPYGLAIHPVTQHVYISDGTNRIIELNPQYEVVATHGTSGRNEGQFNDPRGLSISLAGVVAVVEYGMNRVQLFSTTPTWTHLRTYPAPGAPAFHGCVNATFDQTENLYIADEYNEKVHKYNAEGVFCGFIGTDSYGANEDAVAAAKEKEAPVYQKVGFADAISINHRGELVVFQRAGDAVHVFSVAHGGFLRAYPVEKAQANWNYLTRFKDGGFVLTQYNRGIVTLYSHSGELLRSLKLDNPVGTGFAANGDLLVVGRDSGVLSVF